MVHTRFKKSKKPGEMCKMDCIKGLKASGRYTVPFHEITWKTRKHVLDLEAIISKETYDSEDCDLVLPPTELGQCKDWCIKHDGDVYRFTAEWDIRRVRDNLEPINTVNSKLMPCVIKYNAA